MVLRIYVENSKLFVCVSDAFFRQPRLMGYFFTFSTLEGPTNAYYFVILKVLLIYFGNLQHEKGFGFQSLKGEILHPSSWDSSIFLWELCNGPIKVNLEFSFSFFGYSFLGLEPNIYLGFKPEIHFVFQFQFISQQLLIVSLYFSTKLSSPTWVLIFFLS